MNQLWLLLGRVPPRVQVLFGNVAQPDSRERLLGFVKVADSPSLLWLSARFYKTTIQAINLL